eukprot:365126-Chlamydomonas_euryale.AAC.35
MPQPACMLYGVLPSSANPSLCRDHTDEIEHHEQRLTQDDMMMLQDKAMHGRALIAVCKCLPLGWLGCIPYQIVRGSTWLLQMTFDLQKCCSYVLIPQLLAASSVTLRWVNSHKVSTGTSYTTPTSLAGHASLRNTCKPHHNRRFLLGAEERARAVCASWPRYPRQGGGGGASVAKHTFTPSFGPGVCGCVVRRVSSGGLVAKALSVPNRLCGNPQRCPSAAQSEPQLAHGVSRAYSTPRRRGAAGRKSSYSRLCVAPAAAPQILAGE